MINVCSQQRNGGWHGCPVLRDGAWLLGYCCGLWNTWGYQRGEGQPLSSCLLCLIYMQITLPIFTEQHTVHRCAIRDHAIWLTCSLRWLKEWKGKEGTVCTVQYEPWLRRCVYMGQQLPVGRGFPIIEASRSHSDTTHSIGLLWTSDRAHAQTSTWQHTTLTTDRRTCPCRGSNPQSQQPTGRRPTT